MKQSLFLCFVTLYFGVYSQNENTNGILKEGKLLYRLEKGSWYGTDDMLSRFTTKKDSVGGYLSYETTDDKIITIFFSKYNPEEILVRYEFDKIPKTEPLGVDTLNKKATVEERNLITIRQDARDRASENKDNFFTYYDNASLNFIPIIDGKNRKVFVLTGPQVSGVVLIGNDYLLHYNQDNSFKEKSKIHNSVLQFPYKADNGESRVETTYHSHILDAYISSTDVCTLLLYKDYVEWKQHIVISKKEVSIFDLEKETILIMKTKAWEKISKSKRESN